MARSARRRDREIGLAGHVIGGLVLSGQAIARNPVLVGGTTAFLVCFGYVSANALWYQPGMHANALYATRPAPDDQGRYRQRMGAAENETLILIEREEAVARPSPRPSGPSDPVLEKVQETLSRLGHYSGPVDGLSGPQTRAAILVYQKQIGLPETGTVNERLLGELLGAAAVPTAAPLPQPARSDAEILTASVRAPDPVVSQVQAGLRAFGNDNIKVDGVIGPATTAAIKEFQTLFGLDVSGTIDDELVAKMREVGLTN
jgi:peptidoglycan hydrolase-like protein with peptidoglycan-binding domain